MGTRRAAMAALLVGVICAGGAAAAGVGEAPRNSLGFAPTGETRSVRTISVADEEKRSLDLRMDFEEPTVGGGIVVTFDPAIVSLTDVVFDGASLGDDVDFRCPADAGAGKPITCPQNAAFVSFGNVSGIAGGTSGERRIATLEFTALASGSTPLGFTVENSFSDLAGKPVQVPEPMGQGLLALVTVALIGRRRRHVAKRG